jgi:large subunit ribosomal protein L25
MAEPKTQQKYTPLDAKERDTGSKAARDIRADDHVPCIMYGKEVDPVPFKIHVRAMNQLIYSASVNLVEVNLNGESWKCVLKDFDLHPITDRPQHADFQVLQPGRKVTLTVPVRYVGIPQGQKNGGDTQYIVREIKISSLPENIPAAIEVDVSELLIGDALHVYDLEGDYDIQLNPEQTLVTVVAPHLDIVEPEADEEEEVLEEGEEVPEGEEGEVPEGEEGEVPEGEEGEAPDEGEEPA